MKKRIPVKSLQVGMYITDLNKDWKPHNNIKRTQGFIRSEAVIEKISNLGLSDIYIDTAKGKDHEDAVPVTEIDRDNQKKLDKSGELKPHSRPIVSLYDEIDVASKIHDEAIGLVNNVMNDVKLGQDIDIGSVDDLADNMLDSIFRNHHALTCLGCIRDKDSYLMEHSVNLSVLMSVYCRSMKMDRSIMHQTMVGALLHDIGKVMVPDEILHKPGKLSDSEFAEMKNHVVYGRDMLKSMEGVSELSLTTMAQHHERIDGSGYPDGLKGDQISEHGKMVAIVDVYDAITADRCYHKGMTPTMAIKKLLEWSDNHLDRNLVNHFIRCIGIYPVGSLTLLESGRLGVVIESNEFDQRLPTVRVMYHTKFRSYIKTEVINLAHPKVQDRIVKTIDPAMYQIPVKDFL